MGRNPSPFPCLSRFMAAHYIRSSVPFEEGYTKAPSTVLDLERKYVEKVIARKGIRYEVSPMGQLPLRPFSKQSVSRFNSVADEGEEYWSQLGL